MIVFLSIYSYFADGMKTIEHFKAYIEDLVGELAHIKQRQDADRRELVEMRDALRASMTSYKEVRVGFNLLAPALMISQHWLR